MKTLVALAFGSLFALAASGPVREVTSQAMLVPLQSVPGFQRGYLFFLEHATVRVYPPDGGPAFVRVLEIPKSGTLSATGLAVDTDGSVAASVGYQTTTGSNGGIVFLDRTGRQTAFLDTGLYMPSNLCYADDHSLWAFGWQLDANLPDRAERQDYLMVRKYSPDGKEAGRYLSRSLFPVGLQPGQASWQSLRIAVARDRVGLLAWSGKNSSTAEWIEMDLNGKLLRRLEIDNHKAYGSMAYTSDGHVYRRDPTSGRLLVLDRNLPEWKDAGTSPAAYLLGADGNRLVFSGNEHGPIRLQWFEQPDQ